MSAPSVTQTLSVTTTSIHCLLFDLGRVVLGKPVSTHTALKASRSCVHAWGS